MHVKVKVSNLEYLMAFVAAYYGAVSWEYQRLVFALKNAGGIVQFSSNPKIKGFKKAVEVADYMAPSTFHQFKAPSRRSHTIKAQELDMVPFLFMDIDYHDTNKPKPDSAVGDVLSAAISELDLPPSLVLDTPRGVHVYWALQDPIYIAWEMAPGTGEWRPKEQALKALNWWRSCSYALCRALFSFDLPADPAVAGQPARLMRMPTPENVVWEAPQYRYSLQELTDKLEQYMAAPREYKLSALREAVAFDGPLWAFPGVPEGERNSTCWKLCIALLDELEGNEKAAWRIIAGWAKRCTPPYPEREARQTFESILRGYKTRSVYVKRKFCKSTGLSRQENAKRVAKIKQTIALETVIRAASEIQAEGINPIQNITYLARVAGVSRNTVIKHIEHVKQAIQKNNLFA